MKNQHKILVLAAALVAGGSTAFAALKSPTSWARNSANSTYGEWDIFSAAGGPNAPDIGSFNPNGAANTFDASGASFVTSGGNIYSFSLPEQITSVLPLYGLGSSSYTTIMLQTRTLGTEANYQDVHLTYSDGTNTFNLSPVARSESDRVSLGGFGGYQVDVAYAFHVPYSPASLTLVVPSESSMSVDRVVVDSITTAASAGFMATPVPEPACLGIAVLLSVFSLRRVRRPD